MKQDALLGIDIGTSSIKYGLFDASGNSLLARYGSYELVSTHPGQIEIDPEALWRSVAGSIREIIESSSESWSISVVGICGMMIMPVFLDRSSSVVRPVIHWQDERLARQSMILKNQGVDRAVAAFSGSLLTGESTINAFSWVRENEPEAFANIRKFVLVKDYIRFRLTGEICTDFGDASGTLMLETSSRQWSDALITEIGLDRRLFPPLTASDVISGVVTGDSASMTGLLEGTPVVTGTGDGICALLGLGVIDDGDVGITVGSAGVVGVATNKLPLDPSHRNYVFCHPSGKGWYSVMATAASGSVLEWYRTSLSGRQPLSLADIDAEAARTKPGAEGLLFLPYILGSRSPHSDPSATGMFLGLRRRMDRAHLSRAVLEGILLEIADLHSIQAEISDRDEMKLTTVKVSGGIVKSHFWVRMLADILGANVSLAATGELGTLGCAILGAKAICRYRDLREAASEMINDSENVNFDASNAVVYREKLRLFREVYHKMKPLLPLFDS